MNDCITLMTQRSLGDLDRVDKRDWNRIEKEVKALVHGTAPFNIPTENRSEPDFEETED
jgi:hypothetical protein